MLPTPSSPTPLTSIPSSATFGRTNELMTYTPPRTAAVGSTLQGSCPHNGPIPNATQMMTSTYPNLHRLASASQASTIGNYQADFSRFKEDLANMIKTKLGVDMGNSRLYQKPYTPEFDFISYSVGCCVPEFMKFNGDDTHTTWEHISQYILQLGETGFHDALCVRLFSLSLTGTAFS